MGGEERLYRSLRRYWHPVLYASELGDGPQQVTLLDERIVVVRLAGEVQGVHRSLRPPGTAVSLGWVEDDVILRCPYHGWTYGPTASARASRPGSARRSRPMRGCSSTWRSSATA